MVAHRTAELPPGSTTSFITCTDTWLGELRALSAGFNSAQSWRVTGSAWQQLSVLAGWGFLTSAGPEPRQGARAVFDPTLRKVILFGGSRTLPAGQTVCGGGLTTTPGGPCNYSDTWAWDGSAWARLCDSVTADYGTEPTPRVSAALADDPVRRRAVLFGGGYTAACSGDAMCPDFYEWNGTTWSRPVPADPSGDGNAQGRVGPILGWDPLGSRFLVASGEDEFTNCGGTAA